MTLRMLRVILKKRVGNQRGSVLIITCFIVALMPALLGLIYDIYHMQVTKLYIQSVADASALSGALAVDETVFKTSKGTKIQHNASDVMVKVDRVIGWNNDENPKYNVTSFSSPSINQTKHSVLVKVECNVPTIFTRFAGGFTSKTISAEGEAAVLVKAQ